MLNGEIYKNIYNKDVAIRICDSHDNEYYIQWINVAMGTPFVIDTEWITIKDEDLSNWKEYKLKKNIF